MKKKKLILIIFAMIFAAFSCVKDSALNDENSIYTSGMIAFTAYDDSTMSDLEVYLVDSDDFSPESINISNSVAVDCYPDWIYDKSGIIYISTSGTQSSLYKATSFSHENYLLFPENDPILKISTSPAESKLAYFKTVASQQRITLNLLNLETLDTLQLASFQNASNLHVAWSIDGVKLAVRSSVILVFDSQQGNLLYNINSSGNNFAWDENGDGLYIIRSGNLLHVDTLQERTILADKSLAYPAFSPDRRSLACISQATGNTLIVIDLSFGDYVSVGQIQLPQFECDDYRLIDWSPDSRKISFIDFKDGQWDIFTASRDSYYPVDKVTDGQFFIKSLDQ